MTHSDLRILLIQIRRLDHVRDHEFTCFLETSGCSADQVRRFDVFKEPYRKDMLEGIHAVVIGGSGAYFVSQGDIPEETAVIRSIISDADLRAIPLLGICFGAQILTQAFGGEVRMDAERMEVGTFEITKTEAADRCPVLKHLPKQFDAQLGHRDHIVTIPDVAVHLASSERSPHQAFTIPGKPIYAVLWHPELNERSLAGRMEYYAGIREKGVEYGLKPEGLKGKIDALRPSPEASRTIPLFLSEIVLKKQVYPR